MEQLRLVDTTLRDGEQRAGIALSAMNKLRIAAILDECGIYQIEAGVPAISAVEADTIRSIKRLGLHAHISTWNRMTLPDIEASIACGADLLHICVPTSDLHIKEKLNTTVEQLIERMLACVRYAKAAGREISIGFEDASRTPLDFIMEMGALVKAEGVTRLRYADTVGILSPRECLRVTEKLCGLGLAVGIHAHNDLGMAVANSLAAVQAGAGYIDVTFGGIGERAGNCSCVNFIKSAKALFPELVESYDIALLQRAQEQILGIMRFDL